MLRPLAQVTIEHIVSLDPKCYDNFSTGHFFRGVKNSYTENAEKTQRFTETLKIRQFDESAALH